MNSKPRDFWQEKDELLKSHTNIGLEIARLRLGFEVIKKMMEKENSDYQELAKTGTKNWNSLYEQLSITTDRSKQVQIVQEMNKIKNAIDKINQSRLKLEEIMHTIFK